MARFPVEVVELAQVKPSMYRAARQKVQEIKESPPVDPLPEDVQGKLAEILRRAEEEIPATQD